MPDDLLAKAVTFCFASDAPASDLPHDVVHTLMADFARTAIASAVKSERERIGKLLNADPSRIEERIKELRVPCEVISAHPRR